MSRSLTAVLAGLTLVVGFAVGQVTGNRVLSAVVLLAGAGWCVAREAGRTHWGRLVVVVLVAGATFVGSHAVAGLIGPWPAVLLAAVVTGATTWLLVEPRVTAAGTTTGTTAATTTTGTTATGTTTTGTTTRSPA